MAKTLKNLLGKKEKQDKENEWFESNGGAKKLAELQGS